MLAYKLCDLTGASVADVENPLGGSNVVCTLNSQRTGRLLISFDDAAAVEAYPHMRVVKALLDGTPIVCGHIMRPVFNMAERRIEIAFVDPSDRLINAQVNNRGDTNFATGTGVLSAMTNDPGYANIYPNIGPQDQSQIIKRLVDHASPTTAERNAGVPGHGISTTLGSLPASVTRSRVYDTGKQIWEAIVQMSEVESGPDFSLTPVDRTDGVLCKLDTYPSGQGSDRSSQATFEMGLGLDNCANAVFTPDGSSMLNRWLVMGESVENAIPNLYRANQGLSQIAFGIRSGFEARSDVIDSFTLQSIARAKVARDAFPTEFVEITPVLDDGSARYRDPVTRQIVRRDGTYGDPVRLGPDPSKHAAWLGDIVGARLYDRPAVEFEGSGRIYEITYTTDEDGRVLTEAKLTPTISYSEVT